MANFTQLTKEALVILPPPPPRFTLDEWYLNNRMRYRTVDDQHQLADRVLAECDRVRDETTEITTANREEVDHRITEKLMDIDFRRNEILRQRKEVCIEVDNLETYKERIMDAMESLKEQALKICKKCLILREQRIGIDLAFDDVERELKKEMEVIEGAQGLLRRTLEQAHEQVRRLKSTCYFMDRDLEDKGNAYKLDLHNSGLKESSINLSLYHGHAPLDPANITAEEWDAYTLNNIVAASKEINSAVPLRSYINTLLTQCIDDLTNQYNIVNNAFMRRITETKEAKTKMEVQHSETVRQANEMVRNITRLEKAIAEKEGFMALAHTRLGNRAQRPGVELCRDLVETKLIDEIQQLRQNTGHLQQMLAEAQASLRYLLKVQIQLEEDINIKTNTLKIDECDCMTLRESMSYHAY